VSGKRYGHGTTAGGHRDLNTTMIYTHVTAIGSKGVRSPLDQDR